MHNVTDVTYQGSRGRLVQPAEPNGAGVFLIPAWAGLSKTTDEYSNWLADEGFTVLGWDPFSAYAPDLSQEDRRRITMGEILDVDARAEHIRWLDYMQQEVGIGGIGTIGFCMGGRMCMLLCVDPRVKACSTYYPTLRDHVAAWALDALAEAQNMHAPVQIHYPQLDSVTPYATIVQMRSALEARPGTPTTITCCYAQAHHGFLSRNPERDPADRLATQLAWPATIAFYRATLLQASPIEQPARAELGVKG